MHADLIVTNGKVITMDRSNNISEAFAVRGGKIWAMGTNTAIENFANNKTKRIDLQGKTVTPGLIDTHIHVASLGSTGTGIGLAFTESGIVLDVGAAESVDQILDMISEKIRTSKKGDWVITGWPKEEVVGKKGLTRWDLDRISGNIPVFISGYPYSIVNSYLLEKAGITRETESPPGGEIEKDPETGEPTGALAFQAIYQFIPPPPQPSIASMQAAIKKVQENFLAEGLTTYKDAGLRENAMHAYENLYTQGELLCRTQMMYTWLWNADDASEAVNNIVPYGDEKLMLRSVKLSLDGGVSSRTAWSYEDWNIDLMEIDKGNRGYWKIPPDELQKMVLILHRGGLQICCHCCGDRAIDTYLDALENAFKEEPDTFNRHTIIHCNLPTGEAIDRMQRMGDRIAIEPQSPWLSEDRFAAACGPERSKRFFPFKTWLEKGIIVGNGCDFPPEPYPPRLGLWGACTRESEHKKYGRFPFGREESISVQEALYTYTMGGAKCLLWEDKIGSLEPGKFADFVVWDEDLYNLAVEELKNAKVLLTAVNGEILYDLNGTWI